MSRTDHLDYLATDAQVSLYPSLANTSRALRAGTIDITGGQLAAPLTPPGVEALGN